MRWVRQVVELAYDRNTRTTASHQFTVEKRAGE